MPRKSYPPGPPPGDALRSLLERAERGDADALPALRLFLDERPDVWEEAGDLGLQAERAWTALAAGSSLVLSESMTRKYAALLAEVEGPDPTPLEKLAAERVAVSWLACGYFDVVLAQNKGRGLAPAQVEHLQRCQERVQRQHLRALQALARVRRLLPGKAHGTTTDAGNIPANPAAGDRRPAAGREAKVRRCVPMGGRRPRR